MVNRPGYSAPEGTGAPPPTPMTTSGVDKSCDHHFQYAGLRYCDGARLIPGGSARRRYYAHVYFCTSCLAKQGEPVKLDHNSYSPVIDGAQPGTASDCGVPMEDR